MLMTNQISCGKIGIILKKGEPLCSNIWNRSRELYEIIPKHRFLHPHLRNSLIYMLCYFGWIALMGKYAIPKSALKLLLTIPVLAMVFDWTENIGIIAMIRNYPLLPTGLS